MLEDLAAEFQMQTRDVVDRIQKLEESGRLQGITDDRGITFIIDQLFRYRKVHTHNKLRIRISGSVHKE